MNHVKLNVGYLCAVCVATLLIFLGNQSRGKGRYVDPELDFDVPIAHQLLFTAGDRFLAANAAVWRSIVVRTSKMNPSMMALLAKLQDQASWLNPGHEDNYYTATAILPWEGHVRETQAILERASSARPEDVLPSFYLGFNRMYFLADFQGAARAAVEAAGKSRNAGEQNALALMAVKWLRRQGDIAVSVALLKGMAKQAMDPALKAHLLSRVDRLEDFGTARESLEKFKSAKGRSPNSMLELTEWAELIHLPKLSFESTYTLLNGELVMGQSESAIGENAK